jgi:hypothetical protein
MHGMKERVARLVIWLIGLLNLVLALFGLGFAVTTATRILQHYKFDPDIPYFLTAFFIHLGVDLVLVAALVISSIQLMRFRPSAVKMYVIVVILALGEVWVGGALWLLPNGIGRSIAAATGVGGMGMAVFCFWLIVPFAYPIVSAVALMACSKFARVAGPPATVSPS